jgi:recombination protein RecR
MINKIPTLAHLCKVLQQVPYLASKNLYRVATYFLVSDKDKIERFCLALLEAKRNIVTCPECCVWKERDKSCIFCGDQKRDHTIICVVETWQELMAIEKTEAFSGVYHVLGGAICPLEGVGPEDLTIDILINRVKTQQPQELILATNQTPEGEATAAFIARKLKETGVKISCLARGMPVGAVLEGLDKLTVYKALSERRPF